MKKIDIGKVKTTRDGSEVLELHRLERLPGYAWAGVIRLKHGSVSLESWTEEGKYDRHDDSDSPYDLVETGPYDGWQVDDKVWVKTGAGRWIPRYFSRVDEDGIPRVFHDGMSSFTAGKYPAEVPIDSVDGYFVEIRLASEFTPDQTD
jgi:hypothetical protein